MTPLLIIFLRQEAMSFFFIPYFIDHISDKKKPNIKAKSLTSVGELWLDLSETNRFPY